MENQEEKLQDAEDTEETEENVEQENTEEAPEMSEPKKKSDELKVVLTMKGNRAIVGIQSPDCDPVFTTLEGDLAAVLSQVPALVEAANAKWDASPKYPKAKLPEPPPPPPTPARTVATSAPSRPAQPSFF